MALDELVRHLLANRRRVTEVCDGIFDAHPPEPEIVIGTREAVPVLEGVKERLITKEGPKGAYLERIEGHERIRLIFINPKYVQDTCRQVQRERRERIQLQPKSEILRVLAKEYGQHTYSFLHDWATVKQARAHTKYMREMEEVTPGMLFTLPLGLVEAIGIATMLRAAKEMQMRDDYRRFEELNIQRHRSTLSREVESGGSSSTGRQVLLVARTLGKVFSTLDAVLFREVVRLPINKLTDFTESVWPGVEGAKDQRQAAEYFAEQYGLWRRDKLLQERGIIVVRY